MVVFSALHITFAIIFLQGIVSHMRMADKDRVTLHASTLGIENCISAEKDAVKKYNALLE